MEHEQAKRSLTDWIDTLGMRFKVAKSTFPKAEGSTWDITISCDSNQIRFMWSWELTTRPTPLDLMMRLHRGIRYLYWARGNYQKWCALMRQERRDSSDYLLWRTCYNLFSESLGPERWRVYMEQMEF